MRILYLAKQLPGDIPDGYDIRFRGTVERLALSHDVDVLSYDVGKIDDDLAARLSSCRTIEIAPDRVAPPLQRAAEFFSERSLLVPDEGFARALKETLEARDYDLVLVAGWALLHYVPLIRRVSGRDLPVIADPADDEVRAKEIALTRTRGLKERFGAWRRLVQTRKYQSKYLKDLDMVLFVSPDDAASTLARVPGAPVVVCQNGVDTDRFAPGTSDSDSPVLVFEGTMTFPPNVEGAVRLARDVLPLVRTEVPEARALLVGRDPVPEVRALASDAVEVTGTVADVRAEVLRGSVFVCPLVSGTGQKNKLLQAWSMGLPVVATTMSTTGLDARSGENVILADETQAIADACVKLLRDPAERRRLGEAGRRTAVEVYSFDRKMGELQELVEGLVDGASSAAPSPAHR